MPPSKRLIIVLALILLLWISYRVFAVYTIRSGECRPKPVDPNLRLLTRDEQGQIVSYPERIGYPQQTRPLLVMTYNIAGHDQLYDPNHIRKIAAVIDEVKPDIVGLQEVHRKTWQARFHDQARELHELTGLNIYFGPSYSEVGGGFGNAILTRGDFLAVTIHPLPSIGEPRSVIESVIRIDGATINVYVTHLTSWGRLKSASRDEELHCLAKHVRTSLYPYLLLGDFNATPQRDEMQKFRQLNAAQICGEDIGVTLPMLRERIDYIFADYGWDVRSSRVVKSGPSDHYPVIAELFWNRS
ncbi:MAG TPA: endonuclease/exonuclease/phosphatase family protein [Thermoanaerobaculia bacterium]|nr:endonuclease/exonuclease/phosphatase family protein [Thermoanaerobaculia bacterium]